MKLRFLLAAALLTTGAQNVASAQAVFSGTNDENLVWLSINGGQYTPSAFARGWCNASLECNGTSATNNYFTGQSEQEYRGWWAFGISDQIPAITSASLMVSNGYTSPALISFFDIFDTSLLGTGSADSYADQGGGHLYAQHTYTGEELPVDWTEIVLNATAIANLNAARGGDFGIGAVLGEGEQIQEEQPPEQSAAPEPASVVLIGTGLIAVAGFRRRRR